MFVWRELHQVYQRTNFQKKSCHPWPGSTPDTSLKTNGYPLKVDLWKMIHFLSEGGFLFKVKKFVHFRAKKKPLKKTRPGSVGHPELCRRPCIYFAQGQCRNSADCSFWTLDLERKKKPVVVCTTGLGKVSSKSVVNVRWIYSLQNSRKGWIFGFWATR